MKNKLLPTTVVGSHPKPKWLNHLIVEFEQGNLDKGVMESAFNDSVRAVVKVQELAGLDIFWDGEMRREEMTSYFAENIDGFTVYGPVRVWGNNYYKKPAITGELRYRDEFSLSDYRFLSSLTDRGIKVPLTGPYTIVDWSFNEHYNTKEDAVYALAEVINEELKALVAAGADFIQIDDPAISTHVDELEVAKKSVEIATKGVKAYIGLHICYGDYSKLYPQVLDFPVDQLDFELANKNFEDIKIFREHDFTKDIGFGCVDVHTKRVESVAEIKENITKSFEMVEPKQVYVDPDCGVKLLSPQKAFEKLKNMCDAAEELREEL
ncbi:MAG: methionine synthase [Candidatus Altiarchaeales archaeon ex4484_96]|nr:MAG: methionine synthase [Candidatus Altiarchaeales archaeon ex4484_96]